MVGRNEPCPCGSGRKFKKCCIGKLPGTWNRPGSSPRKESGIPTSFALDPATAVEPWEIGGTKIFLTEDFDQFMTETGLSRERVQQHLARVREVVYALGIERTSPVSALLDCSDDRAKALALQQGHADVLTSASAFQEDVKPFSFQVPSCAGSTWQIGQVIMVIPSMITRILTLFSAEMGRAYLLKVLGHEFAHGLGALQSRNSRLATWSADDLDELADAISIRVLWDAEHPEDLHRFVHDVVHRRTQQVAGLGGNDVLLRYADEVLDRVRNRLTIQ